MMIWGDDTEMKALENQAKICAALTDEEKNEEVRLSTGDKQEIAEVTKLKPGDVTDMI